VKHILALAVALSLAMLLNSTVNSQDQKKPDPPKKKAKQAPPKRNATDPAVLQTLPGFKVELLHTADPATEGSWINLCKDHKGRLIIGGQRNQPVLRVTLQRARSKRLKN